MGEFFSERGGGVRSYLGGLLAAGKRCGHDVVVLAPGPEDSDRNIEGGRVIRYRAPTMPYDSTYHAPIRVDRMRHWVRELCPDVLQLSSPYLPWVASRNIRAPLRTYIYHSDPIGAYIRPATRRLPAWARDPIRARAWAWMRAVCHSCDSVVVAGRWQVRALGEQGIRNTHCVPFGIRHEDFGPHLRSSSLRANLLGPGATGASLLLIAGRLAVEKRQAGLVRAIGELARRRNVYLLVLGDGPERERLAKLCAEQLPGRHALWRFTKDRSEYAQVLASADALVHGSHCETYGFVLVEALASGTPLVVPGAGAAAHLGGEGASVVYSPGAEPGEVARAIDTALSRGEQARQAATRAAAGHPHTDEHFERLFAHYEQLLGGSAELRRTGAE